MKKIMFSDAFSLTKAVLSGRKTQTRRIIPQSVIDKYSMLEDPTIIDDARYNVGEVVFIAQSYKNIGLDPKTIIQIPIKESKTAGVLQCEAQYSPGWTNKMFVRADLMPHYIRINDVWVERLQDISETDCLAEGVGVSKTDNRIGTPISIPFNYYIGKDEKGSRYTTPREAYAALIDKISGKGTFESNPFVFAYEFELIQ